MKNSRKVVLFVGVLCSLHFLQINADFFYADHATTDCLPNTRDLASDLYHEKQLNKAAINQLSIEELTALIKEKLDHIASNFYTHYKPLLFNAQNQRGLEDDPRWSLCRLYLAKEGLKISQTICNDNETYQNIVTLHHDFDNNSFKLLAEFDFLTRQFERKFERKIKINEKTIIGYFYDSLGQKIDKEKAWIKDPVEYEKILKKEFEEASQATLNIKDCIRYEKIVAKKAGLRYGLDRGFTDRIHSDPKNIMQLHSKVISANQEVITTKQKNKTELTSGQKELLGAILPPDQKKNGSYPGQKDQALKPAPEKISFLESISRSVLGGRANQTVFGLLTYSHVFKGTLISEVAGTVCLAVYKIHSLMTRKKKNEKKCGMKESVMNENKL
ncbi:hypothetical protein IPH25_02530 [bacterium]|nr:MAG: hypothetical protein IPG37_04670 [bacterium]QQR62296.1 MAG: hypothetical protein IPH25_02530 [bacterium]QQR63136.1 MAG: hypothetical protein IPH67_01520 [bacterium]